MKTIKKLLISFGIGLLASLAIALLMYFNYYGQLITDWSSFLSNTFLTSGGLYLLVFCFTLLSRNGIFSHFVYIAHKLRRHSAFAEKYKTYPEYQASRKPTTYSLVIFWIPGIVFIAAAIILALF